jgi:hypothetical protein
MSLNAPLWGVCCAQCAADSLTPCTRKPAPVRALRPVCRGCIVYKKPCVCGRACVRGASRAYLTLARVSFILTMQPMHSLLKASKYGAFRVQGIQESPAHYAQGSA